MELKVWVEGIQRIVCGVTETTTCQDVVFALAHATGKVGRFTLIEKWRNNERLLAPNENPLKILMKWGEYSSDVQFMLQRSDQIKADASKAATLPASPSKAFAASSATLSPSQLIDNIGIVKGVPKSLPSHHSANHSSIDLNTPSSAHFSPPLQPPQPPSTLPSTTIEFNSADIRNSLDRKINNRPDADAADPTMHQPPPNLDATNNFPHDFLYAHGPPISSNGALVPPPYRDPPPPSSATTTSSSPSLLLANNHSPNVAELLNRFDTAALNTFVQVHDLADANAEAVTFQNAQYRELIQLIKFQREKLGEQKADLSKFDAEIVYLESKEREQLQHIDAIAREINKTDLVFRQGQEQLQSLQYVEEENELVHQQEKTLKSEITLLRSKLANCETELLQYKNKVRLLLDDIQIEQRMNSTTTAHSSNGRHQSHHQTQQTKSPQQQQHQSQSTQLERHFMGEVERLQTDIDQAIHMAESSHQAADHLKLEVAGIESSIAEKKKHVEQLVNEMKEVNLQSLAVAPSDEIRHLLEGGSSRPGSTRRIIGSPRQLENAVPTSKNPHGVWV